jgi:hypothetical protein
MTSLLKNLKAALEFDASPRGETFSRSLEYEERCKDLPKTDQARRHGYNDGAREHHARLTPLHEALLEVVRALEWYDNVHRNYWAIDLNDLNKVADAALTRLAEAVGKNE